VRVAVTDNGARVLAARVVPRLAAGKPPAEIELVSGNAVLDLSRSAADLAIRVVAPADPSLVRQRLGAVRYALYASKPYLDRAPPWRDGGAGHRIIVPSAELATGPEASWLGEHARAARVACRASNHVTIAVAAEHGAGACVLPIDLAAFHPALVTMRRLPEIPERPVWLVVHRDMRDEPRIRRVADVVATAIRAALA
jgi:DNA-binding transcriptional LysR family regulator